MVALSDSAVSAIRQVIETAETPPAGLRIRVRGGGCAGYQYEMGLDSLVLESDAVFQVNGITLLVDALSRPVLDGVRVDFVDSLNGSGFVIENPNTRAGCGSCGSRVC